MITQYVFLGQLNITFILLPLIFNCLLCHKNTVLHSLHLLYKLMYYMLVILFNFVFNLQEPELLYCLFCFARAKPISLIFAPPYWELTQHTELDCVFCCLSIVARDFTPPFHISRIRVFAFDPLVPMRSSNIYEDNGSFSPNMLSYYHVKSQCFSY